MRKRHEIEVTQRDIDQACRNDSRHCAVATAIARHFPNATRISVDVGTIRFSLPEERKRLFYLTPARAERYIIAFDAGDEIEPFSFRIDNPAAEINMRPRTEPGTPRPERQEAIIRAPTGNGAVIIAKGRKTMPRAMRRKHATRGSANSDAATNVRQYGHRRMRINQH